MPPLGSLSGSVLGLALGDALGFVVEARPPAEAMDYAAELRQGGPAAVGRRAHPDYPFGQYSDDTQLARELLLSLRDGGGWTPAAFARRVAALFAEARDVGAGDGTRGTAHRLLAGVPWRDAATPAPYAGNGSAMRAGPLGALFPARRAVEVAAEQSRVTHADRRCVAGAMAIAGAAALISRVGSVDAGGVTRRLAGWVEPIEPDFAAAIVEAGKWTALPPAAARDALAASGHEPASSARWRGISAFVVPSVLWSLYAALRSPDDYWETVCTAIWPGGDTDSMAAMAGSIVGARVGPAALPAAATIRLTDRGAWGAEQLTRLAEECVPFGMMTEEAP